MDVAPLAARAIIEPVTSQMIGQVEPVLLPEHSASKMQYQTARNQLGRQITQIILSSPNLQTLLPTIARALGEMFEVDVCLIVDGVRDRATPQTAYWCSTDYPAGLPAHQMLLLGHPALRGIMANSSPVAIADIHASETLMPVGWRGEALPIRAVLGIQTQFQFQANGALLVGRIQPHDWTEEEKELLKAASEMVALAISQVQLQQQGRTAAQYQSAINQTAMAIRSGYDLNQILDMAIAGVAEALNVNRGLVLLLKYANPLFQSNSLKRIPKATVTVAGQWYASGEQAIPNISNSGAKQKATAKSQKSFLLSDCQVCGDAFIQAPEPVVINDRQNILSEELPISSDTQSVAIEIFDPEAMPAMLVVPLLGTMGGASAQGTVLGFLVLQNASPRSWQPEEIDFVKSISAIASTSIITNQTSRQMQNLVEERTDQVQRMREVQAKLYEKTRQQVDQLRHLNQLKDEFIDNLSDSLRHPLTKMKLAIDGLRRPELPIEKQAFYINILEQEYNKEKNLIDDLLTLQKLESHKPALQVQKIDLKQLIQGLADSFEEKWTDKGLTLEVDLPTRSLMIQTDLDSLSRTLEELLTNAGKYSGANTTVHLRASTQVNQQVNQIVISLTSTGRGISQEEQTYIFDPFRRGIGVTQDAVVPGTGLGLALVKLSVHHINGAIAVSSCPTDNTMSWETCFTITLPHFLDSTQP
ncbi:GAF domain-containing protein [Microcoleus sp. FACHB-831]|uniref:GAF domain-containing sensor histidine kinase n=1 Tax=Microcoleus sp. FACHB-831 TaxID=2692827 RepID=UPI001689812D|nr:GAF domain-containing protein [Microcoleus sp. FACHB-831]MBD1924484.1 GAF domain-containing protein [Microcoleus sp. FACHB-831]